MQKCECLCLCRGGGEEGRGRQKKKEKKRREKKERVKRFKSRGKIYKEGDEGEEWWSGGEWGDTRRRQGGKQKGKQEG